MTARRFSWSTALIERKHEATAERGVAPAKPTISFTDLPVSQGARDLYVRVQPPESQDWLHHDEILDVLAAADEKDVRNLLWARRAGKL
jgi:hypothetical protein